MRLPSLLQGGDLWNALAHNKPGRLDWYSRGRQIALDVARGLVHLHSQNLVHLVSKALDPLSSPEYDKSNGPVADSDQLCMFWAARILAMSRDVACLPTHVDCWIGISELICVLPALPIAHEYVQDLKSPNILLGRDFTGKIADVGLARSVGSDAAGLSLMTAVSFAAPRLPSTLDCPA